MSCKKSLRTRSGTFTFFDEPATKCVAEKKCLQRGEILAPVTNRHDVKKIKKFIESNDGVEGCRIGSTASYWLGLDITFTGNDQHKVFTNGLKWREKKHSKIYHNYIKNRTDCGFAKFFPILPSKQFYLGVESKRCDWFSTSFYICFKPADNAISESVVREKNGFENEGGVLLYGAAPVFLLALGAFVGVFYQKIKDKAELNELRKKLHAVDMVNTTASCISTGENQ